jgi:hypothetical protein
MVSTTIQIEVPTVKNQTQRELKNKNKAHLLHVISRPDVYDHVLRVRKLPGDVERVGERDEDRFICLHVQSTQIS